MLQQLQVHNLRNIQHLNLNNLHKNNLITGANGAGKSSILEAIHILLTGKSFRTSQINRVISDGSDELTVSGLLDNNLRLGVTRNKKSDFQVRINNTTEQKLSALAAHMPIRQITPESFLMLTAGSKQRRQFLDFSVFHVKHEFANLWKKYQRQLKQRNALLKQSASYADLIPWDEQMFATITSINTMRAQVFEQLIACLEANQLTFLPQYKVQYALKLGVNNDALKQQYADSYITDKRYGHSTLGPHKADLSVTIDGHDAHTIISRGELKMLIISMTMAQIDWLRENHKPCCLIIDDLTSELDNVKQEQLLASILNTEDLQCFISSINCPEYLTDYNDSKLAMFHVKHGELV